METRSSEHGQEPARCEMDIAPEVTAPKHHAPRCTYSYIYPSPSMPITMNNHEFRRAWFDLEDLPPTNESGSDSVCRQINHILQSLEQIVHAELHGRPQSPKVVVAGFSQGGATAMMLALTSLHEIGGVASLSGWIPHISRPVCSLHSKSSCAVLNIRPRVCARLSPLCPSSGAMALRIRKYPWQLDRKARFSCRKTWGFRKQRQYRHLRQKAQSLLTPHYRITFRSYEDLGHDVCQQEMQDLAAWLDAIF